MRTLDGRILVDLGDTYQSNMTGSVQVLTTSSINENETTYALLPERINAVPFVSTSVFNTSTPQIKPIQFNDPDRYNLYIDQQGVVKVAAGSSFILRFKGMQPPIYNVENGIPTEYSDQTKLVYEWQLNGEAISVSVNDPSRPDSYAVITGSYNEELVFNNISPKHAGTYGCVVSNDIGSTESELINIEVYNPDIEDLFYRNLIPNPYGKDGTDGWNSPDLEFTTGRFSDAGFEKFSQPWNVDLFGYSKDMLYPRPYQLNTYHIRNSNFEQDLLQEGYYFTRERFKYKVKDGKAVVNASCDIDLTDAVEYIQGSIYGISGVRAVFGCYIGNAISRYRVTVLNALISRRSSKYTLLPSKARLDIINTLLAGIPQLLEQVKVTIQEFDGETHLLSKIWGGGEVPGYEFYDPWRKALWNTYGTPSADITAGIPDAINVQPDTVEGRLVEIVQTNKLFPSEEYVPTYGQHVRFEKVVIDQLNFKTNKIRINIMFEAFHDVVGVFNQDHVESSDECFEYVPWEWITLPMHWPAQPADFLKDPQTNDQISVDWYNKKVFNLKAPDDMDAFQYATLLGTPRAMATGFNLILMPVEFAKPIKSYYYANTILNTMTNEYPRLKTGTSIGSQVGAFLGSLSDYTYEIIGVEIRNRYNLPYNANGAEDKLGDGTVATRTSIATYKYVKTHNQEFPDVLNFTSSIWQPFTPVNDNNFKMTGTGTDEYIIVYNSSSGDLRESTLENVIGNISTNIIKYTNNLVVDVPIYFQTQSIMKKDYLKNISFTMNLIGEDYGIRTTESFQSGQVQEFKAERLRDWTTLASTSSYNYNYKWLEKIDSPTTNPTTFTSAISNVQHLVYGNRFNERWTPSGQSKLNLASNFQFTSESYYERISTASATVQNQSYTNNQDRWWAEQRARTALTIEGALYWGANVNGQNTTTLKEYRGTTVSTGTTQAWRYNGQTWGYTTIPVYYAQAYAVGKTKDRVKLAGVQNNGIQTPSAIVIPSQQKIYYFIYNYVDNSLNES